MWICAFVVSMLAAAVAQAQPKVGLIEVYGLRKVSQEKVLKALGATIDGPLPNSKGDAEERIEEIDGVIRVSISAICCDKGRAILYVGVEERGSPHFEFHEPPGSEIKVPEEVEKEWLVFLSAVDAAARRNDLAEDLRQGHSLMADPDARRSQERFLEFAETHFALLRDVVRNAADPQQRTIAAYVLGYSKDKKLASDDLQYAIRDAEPTVRNNAIRALMAIAVLAELQPELGIRVPSTWFVEMLNSVEFTDRNKASTALVNLTEKRNSYTLQHLRERAIPALTEMAKWHSLNHALPPFILLGRLAGLPEDQIQSLWQQGDRETLFRKVKETGPRKK